MTGYRSTLSALLTTLVLTGLLAAPTQAQDPTPGLFAFAQVIHNVPNAGPVDVYVNDVQIIDNLTFRSATAFEPLLCPNTCKATIDIVAGDDPDNSAPLFSTDEVLQADVYYGAYVLGIRPGDFEVLFLDDLRTYARAPGKVEYLQIHGVPGFEVDLFLLDENGACEPTDPATCFLLANNFEFGEFFGYWQLDPRVNYFEVTTADGSQSLVRQGLDFTAYEGQTVTLLGSPILGGGGMVIDGPFVAFDSEGNKIVPMALTRTVEATATETMVVEGNYPNPFNPSTSIRFDLAEPAQVRLDVIDVLGRTVMTKPAQRFEAGTGHSFTVNASSLASGIYLYRVTALTGAHTLTHTGRMILSK